MYRRHVITAQLDALRETKTDAQLRDDARYFNKSADFLRARFRERTYYERLGITDPACPPAAIRQAYRVRERGGMVACRRVKA